MINAAGGGFLSVLRQEGYRQVLRIYYNRRSDRAACLVRYLDWIDPYREPGRVTRKATIPGQCFQFANGKPAENNFRRAVRMSAGSTGGV